MPSRRSLLYAGLTVGMAASCFSLGSLTAHQMLTKQLAANDARIAALRDEMARSILAIREEKTATVVSGTAATTDAERHPEVVPASGAGGQAATLVEEVKRQLQSEMGLLPVQLLRDRRRSFVELNAYDNLGKSSYGTAGYLGNGYFITVKHGVIALDSDDDRESRRITSITVRY